MDECTASVDVRTDEKIQEMIRVVFNHCTVFAIAHRLATIIDYDKVVVLEKGELQQFGAPLELLAEKEGIFARLVEETGPAVSAHLCVRAILDPSVLAQRLVSDPPADSDTCTRPLAVRSGTPWRGARAGRRRRVGLVRRTSRTSSGS